MLETVLVGTTAADGYTKYFFLPKVSVVFKSKLSQLIYFRTQYVHQLCLIFYSHVFLTACIVLEGLQTTFLNWVSGKKM